MTDNASSRHAAPDLDVGQCHLARQPVLDRQGALFGYALRLRDAEPAGGPARGTMQASAALLAHAAQLGLGNAIGAAQAFIDVDAAVIAGDLFAFLPREQVVLVLEPTVAASSPLLQRLAMLKGHGFRFALGGVRAVSADLEALLPMADWVRIDLRALAAPALAPLAAMVRHAGVALMADQVATRADYGACRALGFDYFQGYYFAQPQLISGRALTPSQLAIMELLKMVTSEADNGAVEQALKRDATLALNLLRLVNTPAAGARARIGSIGQALLVLGRRQLQRWLQIMLYAGAGAGQPAASAAPLLMLATSRARLLELLAGRLRPGQRNVADTAFTVGILSLMDALFGIPMAEIVRQIPVIDEVALALSARSGFFGELLRLAEAIEQMHEGDDLVTPALCRLAICGDELVQFELAAFAWSERVVHAAL